LELDLIHRRALSLSDALRNLGRFDESREHYEHALRVRPDYQKPLQQSVVASRARRVAGRLAHYEFRWQLKGVKPGPKLEQPTWDGAHLPDKTILLYAEQGHGDTLQFIRYAAEVKRRVGKVLVQCPATLVDLVSTCAGVDFAGRVGPVPAV